MSSAEYLPSEILDRILFYIASDSYHSAGGVTNKDGLCSCSLTCRYWAERTAPALFDTIVLQSQEDLSILLKLMTSSRRRLSHHIQSLHILHMDDTPRPPWTYHVLLLLAHKLPNLNTMVYTDVAIRPGRKRHSHPLLPTRLPCFFSSFATIEDLWLQDQSLHSFTDLIHIVGRLPKLKALSCGRITWKNQPLQMPESRARFPNRLSTVHFLNCRAAWPAVWLFTAPAISPRGSRSLYDSTVESEADFGLFLDSSNARVVNDIIQCFLSDDRLETSTFTLQRVAEHIWHLVSMNTTATMKPDAPRSEEPCVPDITFVLSDQIDTIPVLYSDQVSNTRFSGRHSKLDRVEFDRLKDMSNPFRAVALSLLPWDRLATILYEAQMPDVTVSIHLSAENSNQAASCEQLEDAILAKVPARFLNGEDSVYKFHRIGWQRKVEAEGMVPDEDAR